MTNYSHEHTQLLTEVLDKISKAIGRPYYGSKTQQSYLLFRIAHVYKPNSTLIDLGGGLSPVNAVLSKLGTDVFVYDLLSTYWDDKYHTSDENRKILDVLQSYGVKFIEKNLENIDLVSLHGANSIDTIVSHHCIEHFHNSPKIMLESAMEVIKPNGHLLIEVPNAANIFKRVKLFFGITNYGSYTLFYNAKAYYGHIREYTIGDLKTLAILLKAKNYKTFGTNYLGLDQLPSFLRKIFDTIIRFRAGWCAAIYLDIKK